MAYVEKVVCSPVFIWVAIFIILLLAHYVFGVRYISTFEIIKNHLNCFKKKNGKIMFIPFLDYFILPFIMGYGTVLVKEIDSETINIILIIISILTAMLFTLLSMTIEMKSKINQNPNYFSSEAEISKKALLETYYAVMFEILISVVLLVLCFANCFMRVFGKLQSFLIYSLTYLLIINLLIIIKRIFRVIDVEIEK